MAERRTWCGEHRGHWVLLLLGMLILLGELSLNGYVNHVGASGAARPAGFTTTPIPADQVGGGGPILRQDQTGRLTSAMMPAGTIALTFDDGPDPQWTPQILDILRRHGAHATFFVLGSKVNQYPDLTRRILAEGHDLGVHTFSHADLGQLPDWRRQIEITQAQNAIAAATGWTTSLIRAPYLSTPHSVTAADLGVIRDTADAGYLTVLADRDTRDWASPGVEAIVQAATPPAGAGAVVMLHDGGGDRRQTVVAVGRLLAALPDRRFTSVSQALGHTRVAQATLGVRVRGNALRWAQTIGGWLATGMNILLFIALTIGVLRVLVQVVFAQIHRRQGSRRRRRSRYLGPVTVIVPAYNEEANIAATVRSLAASDYPVVDDGSTDGTSAIVAGLAVPNVRLIRQANAGKPAALNTGIHAAGSELLVLVDGDTVFAPETVGRLIQPFINPEIGGVSGNTKVANRRGLLGRWQHLEYVIGFNLDRRMFDLAECMPTVPGAIGAFRRQTLRQVGGVSSATLAEDTDLTMAVLRGGWRVVYQEDALAWTEVPSSLGQLWRQRYRWCYGTMQAMWKHRRALVERGRSGKLGRRGLLYLLMFQVLLPLCAPAVDVYAIYGVMFLPWAQALAVWAGFVGIQLATAAYALRLDREPLGPLWTLPLQQIVYRQLMYLVVVQSCVAALLGSRQRWHRMLRTGEADAMLAAGRTG